MHPSFFRDRYCDAHICTCCQGRQMHKEDYAENCKRPAELTCYPCSESEVEGYCWLCNHEGR